MICFTRLRSLMAVAALLAGTAAWGAPSGFSPYIGYVYPAGGQQGTVVRVTIGGQRLRQLRDVTVSGKGVHATIVGYEAPLNALQREALQKRLKELMPQRARWRNQETRKEQKQNASAATGANAAVAAAELPDYPGLRNLEQLAPWQLRQVAEKYLNRAKQPKPPIAENAIVDVTFDRDAAPGDREIRILTPAGLSNPLVFQVGQAPEVRAPERDAAEQPLAPVTPPVVLNGQILPGAIARFPLKLRQGQKLVIAAQARHLIPYLADAVPGWFQARLTLFDAHGKELASADHCGYDPDPVLFYQAPADGEYTLQINDSLYRGREDFVYRIVVGEKPLSADLYPAGSCGGVPLSAAYAAQNPFAKPAQEALPFWSASLPRVKEVEPNDTARKAMRISLPRIIQGRIAKSGDTDVYQFTGKAGDTVIAEVYARRLGSSLDSLLRLSDAAGRVIAQNDDQEDRGMGLMTHHADSYLSVRLPKTGSYCLQLSDAECHGGETYNYFLRLSAPQPDFALRATPSAINLPVGRTAPITVFALRKDGWNGDITVALKGAPEGFTLSGAVIPAGRNSVRMTLTAPAGRFDQPISLQLEGSAQIGGKTVARLVVPTDTMMQAFAYEQLVPAQQMLALVTPGRRMAPSLTLAKSERLRIPAGGKAEVQYTLPWAFNAQIRLELVDPPAGVTLQNVSNTSNGWKLTLAADGKQAAYADNLIVEAFTEANAGRPGGARQKARFSLGVLPAIPFEIVRQ